MYNLEKGGLEIVFILLIAVAAIFAVNGFVSVQNNSANISPTPTQPPILNQVIVTQAAKPGNVLQVMPFTIATTYVPTPTSTPVPTPTSTPVPQTQDIAGTGSPGQTAAEQAISLVNLIAQNCPSGTPGTGIVNAQDGCLEKIQSLIPGPIYDELNKSVSHDNNLQCVGFAVAVSHFLPNPLPFATNGFGDAYTYAGTNPPGYQWIPYPRPFPQIYCPSNGFRVQPGDIAVFDKFNHIGMVIADLGDGVFFELAEANGGSGTVDLSYTYHYDCNFAGVLRPT